MKTKPIYPRTFLRRRVSVQRDIDHLLDELHETVSVGLHLGCGPTRIKGLTNCDLHSKNADLNINATDLSKFADDSVDLIEHHHMIEHLSFADVQLAIKEWARALKSGGLLVITCPDISVVLRKWFSARHYWKYEYIIKMIYGSQEHDGMFHKSAFDRRRLAELLAPNGLSIEFSYSPYPNRPTPSLLVIARKA